MGALSPVRDFPSTSKSSVCSDPLDTRRGASPLYTTVLGIPQQALNARNRFQVQAKERDERLIYLCFHQNHINRRVKVVQCWI